ncbi:hypothetical protein [Brevibacillus humidisoli]|nr:hypothetical protein [Brevibacillus humidisoli]
MTGMGHPGKHLEQGIVWQGGRVTEKWLHDAWLREQQVTPDR